MINEKEETRFRRNKDYIARWQYINEAVGKECGKMFVWMKRELKKKIRFKIKCEGLVEKCVAFFRG